jgi:outer membrane protein assembly factor BamB
LIRPKRHFGWLQPALWLLAFSLPALGANPEARQVYAPLWQANSWTQGPCLLSLVMQPKAEEACIPWTRRHESGPAFHAASGLVLLGGPHGRLNVHSAIDGALVYSVKLPGNLIATPTLADDGVYFGTDGGHVLRIDITSGAVLWDEEVDAEVLTPVVVDGDQVYVITGQDTLYALNRRDGAGKWLHKHPLPASITVRGQAKPLVRTVRSKGDGAGGAKKRVFAGRASGHLHVFDALSGELVRESRLGDGEAFFDVDADPVWVDGHVVAASYTGGISALNPVNLVQAWRIEESGITRLARGGSGLVVAAGAKKVVGIDADEGRILWRFTYKKGAPTRLVVKGGRVHLASDRGALYVLDLMSGRPLQYFGTGLGFAGDLAAGGDMLFAVSTAGRLFALSNAFAGRTQAGRRAEPEWFLK